MKTRSILFLLSLVFCFQQNGAAQNLAITYTNSNSLFVCGADTFSISVRNLSAQQANNGVVKITLPSGLSYLPGTVSGAVEQNISNVQQPVLGIAGIAPGATLHLQFQITANCAAAVALDMGNLFFAQIEVQTSIGNAQISTAPIPVETGLALIQSITDVQMTGERLDTLSRTICVRNTRIGPISELFFEDAHEPGFEISISSATNAIQTPTNYKSTFGGNFFSAFGDGDKLLELNETVCFTEKIAISDCGIPLNYNESVLRVGWGCNGEICRYDSAVAGITIIESTRVPNLKMTPVWNPPLDYCGNISAVAGIKMNNIGHADAKNVALSIKVSDPNHVGIVANSFRLTGSFGTIPLVSSVAMSNTLMNCNQQAAADINITVPLVGALDSATLLFDYINCSEVCDQLAPGFSVEVFYKKDCPANGFVSTGLAIEADPDYRLNPSISLNVSTCFQNGETYPFGYKLISKRLTQNQGFINLIFDVPANLSWSDSCVNLLSGAAPVGFTAVQDTNSKRTLVTLTYQLPLSSDTVTMPFCLRYGCDSTSFCENDTTLGYTNGHTVYIDLNGICTNSCTVRFPIKTNWTLNQNTPINCGTTACNEMYLGLSKDYCYNG
ncbi:MAG: hypothetical protein WCR52_04060, partial [Bacteroidota bacterium]